MSKLNSRKFISFEERKNEKKAALYIFLTIVAIVILYFAGLPLIGKMTVFITSLKGNNSKISTNDTTPPPPPKFKYFQEFTNQPNITLSGNTEAGATVKLTLNGSDQETLADNNGQFTFNITLQDGNNVFAATATDQSGNQSQKSDDETIVFDKKAPDLEITSPSDNSGFFGSAQRQVTIQGNTEIGGNVTINDRIVSVDDSGAFQYTTTLSDGGNSFDIKATDQAGNVTEKNINLNFTP